jgi:curved DNA-binding protein
MNYYQILGVDENASQDDIKKAYKKLAMKHHPDRGGDNKKFQEISQAYDTLSDSNKKSQYDAELNGFGNPFMHVHQGQGFPDFGEMFGFHFGPGFAQHRQARKNRDLTLRIAVSFKQSFTGTQVEAKYTIPSGKDRTIIVDVPAGVHSGQTLRYGGLGDDTVPGIPPGNLNVTIIVEPDSEWHRRDNDLCKVLDLNFFEAMTGCTKEVKCLDGSTMPLVIRPGIHHGAEFNSNGRGFRDLNTGRLGSLVIIINIKVPEITNPSLVKKIKDLHAEINNLS